jgi:DNA modification methylase
MTDLSYIAEGLRALAVPIGELHEDAANARVGHDVERIAASLAQFGQRKPLIANKAQGNKIEAGNGTFRAAKSLGWEYVAVLFVDDDPATAAAFGIADNRTGEFSKWDPDALDDLVETVGDLFTGFTQDELDEVIGRDGKAKPMDDPGPQDEKSSELQEKWNVEPGDLWTLGEHFLMCGDSTCVRHAWIVMGWSQAVISEMAAALCFTSPPYWVGKSYESQTSEAEIDQFIAKVAMNINGVVRPDCSRVVINTGTGFTTSFDKRNKRQVLLLIDKWTGSLFMQGWNLRHVRHWLKGGLLSASGAKTDLIDQHCEFLGAYEHDQGRPMGFEDVLNEQDVNLLLTFYERHGKSRGQNKTGFGWAQKSYWDDLRGTASANGHVAAFPIELPMRHLLLYTKRGEIVFEPFCGSGTTLIACEILDRKCRAIELDPAYCAATLERWSIMTGEKPARTEYVWNDGKS